MGPMGKRKTSLASKEAIISVQNYFLAEWLQKTKASFTGQKILETFLEEQKFVLNGFI